VFSNPVGKIGLVETDFGFHIIKVTDKQDGVRLATIARKIEASEKTTDNTYTQATKFEMDANIKPFEDVAKKMKLTVAPSAKFKALEENVGGLGPQRTIVRWAFNNETKVGDVKRFEIANLGQVIAKVKKVNPAGLTPIEDARPGIEPILRNKKKAEKLKAKLKGASLEAIATANATTVQTATDLTMENAVLPNAGQELKVIGVAFGAGLNKISAPIEGTSGVYIIKPKAVTKAPAITDYAPYLAKLKGVNSGKANSALPTLKADATIEDNRSKFNY
jgi:peptidyl-prolyl cis-trans isomerase D